MVQIGKRVVLGLNYRIEKLKFDSFITI